MYITFVTNEYFLFSDCIISILKLAYFPYAHFPFPNASMIYMYIVI